MTHRTARLRARILAAVAAGAAATLVLSGCTLIDELTATDGGSGGDGDLVLVDESTAPDALEFFDQDIDWGACDAGLTAPEQYRCATVQAPMDWAAPGEREPIELFLVKRPADGASKGTMFTNPGGPGASGADFVAASAEYFFSTDLRENYDIIGWDPRGVGRSSAVECRDDEGMDEYFYGVPDGADAMTADEWYDWGVEQAIAFGRDCAMNTGELLGYVDTASTVQDLDLLRALVGDTKLTYFGLSYGTDIGAQYIDRYPERVGRIVLDGATDPTVPMFDVVIDQQQKFGDATRNYLRDCFTSADCPYESTDVDGAIAEMQAVMDEADRTLPKNHDGRVLTSGVVQMAITVAMYDSSSWQYLSMAFAEWFDSADPQVFFLLSDSYYGRDMEGHYDSNMFEAFAAINCLDYPLVTDEAAIRDFHERLEEASLFYTPAEGDLESGDVTCENWPVQSKVTEQRPVVGAGADPVLVVAVTNDPATPLKWAQAVAEQLESGVLLEFDGEGHIAYSQGAPCVVRAIDDYFIDGTVPADPTYC